MGNETSKQQNVVDEQRNDSGTAGCNAVKELSANVSFVSYVGLYLADNY